MIFHNSLFQQELKQSRRQISQQRAYDELEAEVYIDFAEELDDQQQNGIGKVIMTVTVKMNTTLWTNTIVQIYINFND